MSSVLERVKKVVAENLGMDEEQAKPEVSLEDLGADSLDLIEIIMGIENEFSEELPGLVIPDEKVYELKSIQDIVDHLKQKGVRDK